MSVILFVVIFVGLCFGMIAFRGAPYVPTRHKQLNQIFDKLYKIKKSDIVVDLGSGDGALLREAAKRGAERAVGYELNPILVVISKLLSVSQKKVKIKWTDFWREDLPGDTSLVYVFADGRDVKRVKDLLNNHVKKNRKDIIVISYAFSLPGLKVKKTIGPMHLYELKA